VFNKIKFNYVEVSRNKKDSVTFLKENFGEMRQSDL